MKTYDIRNIYVGMVAKQTNLEQLDKQIYQWGYDYTRVGLFVKTLLGYKDMFSGEIYQVASHKTKGQIVIAREQIYPLAHWDSTYTNYILNVNNSMRATKPQLEFILDALNKEMVSHNTRKGMGSLLRQA